MPSPGMKKAFQFYCQGIDTADRDGGGRKSQLAGNCQQPVGAGKTGRAGDHPCPFRA